MIARPQKTRESNTVPTFCFGGSRVPLARYLSLSVSPLSLRNWHRSKKPRPPSMGRARDTIMRAECALSSLSPHSHAYAFSLTHFLARNASGTRRHGCARTEAEGRNRFRPARGPLRSRAPACCSGPCRVRGETQGPEARNRGDKSFPPRASDPTEWCLALYHAWRTGEEKKKKRKKG